jgi:hypothetical protein
MDFPRHDANGTTLSKFLSASAASRAVSKWEPVTNIAEV